MDSMKNLRQLCLVKCLLLCFLSLLLIQGDLNRGTDSNVTTMPMFRIWSLARGQFLVLKISDGAPNITCTGTGNEDEAKNDGSSILEMKDVSNSNANGYSFVFKYKAKKYALHVDENGKIETQEVGKNNSLLTEVTFVPQDFILGQTGPFKALTVSSTKCLAADIGNGCLSLKAFDAVKPYPGTIFIISKI